LILCLVISERLFETPQPGGENEPTFGSRNQAPAVPLVAVGLRQFLFGQRAALGRCKKHAASDHPCKALLVTGGTKVSLFKTEQSGPWIPGGLTFVAGETHDKTRAFPQLDGLPVGELGGLP